MGLRDIFKPKPDKFLSLLAEQTRLTVEGLDCLRSYLKKRNSSISKKIRIASFINEKNICLRVSDSGPGIADYLRDQIFDPFYTTKDGNTGIGLSICQRIVAGHGGFLTLSKSKWGGAEFTIEIPFPGD